MSDVFHPTGDASQRNALARMVESLRRRREIKLAVHAKACFLEPDGKTLTLAGNRLLADLRDQAKLFGSSVTRDRDGRIDRDQMLRIEGRREIVLRLVNLLELGPQEVAQVVEVDDGRI